MSRLDSATQEDESTIEERPLERVFGTAQTKSILLACSEFPSPKWVYIVDDGVYRLEAEPKEVHHHHYAVGISQPDSSNVEIRTFHDSDADSFQCLIPKFPSEKRIKERISSLEGKVPLGGGSLSVSGAAFEVGDAVGCDSFIAAIVDVLGNDLLVYNLDDREYTLIQPEPLLEDISDGYYTHYQNVLSET